MTERQLPLIISKPVGYDDNIVRFVVLAVAHLTGGYDVVIIELDNRKDDQDEILRS